MGRKDVRLNVEGLDDLRRELQRLDLADDLKQANHEVGRLVVRRGQGKAFTPLQQKAAASLKSAKQARKAVVSGGGARAQFFGGAEFGAGQDQPRVGPSGRRFLGYNQFQPWRGSGRNAGYFLYPAIRDAEQEIVDLYGDELEKITGKAFPD